MTGRRPCFGTWTSSPSVIFLRPPSNEKLMREFQLDWVLGRRHAFPREKVVRSLELLVGLVQVSAGLVQVSAGLVQVSVGLVQVSVGLVQVSVGLVESRVHVCDSAPELPDMDVVIINSSVCRINRAIRPPAFPIRALGSSLCALCGIA
jgi:hypothetical protein